MDNFLTAKIYRLAAWTKPLPQPAQRELRLAFSKGQRQPLVRPPYHPRRQREPAAAGVASRCSISSPPWRPADVPAHADDRGQVPGTRTAPVPALGGEGWSGMASCHLSYKALPLDNDEVLGLMRPAGPLAVAGHVTERVHRPQDLQPRVVGSGAGAARAVDDVHAGQLGQADHAAAGRGPGTAPVRRPGRPDPPAAQLGGDAAARASAQVRAAMASRTASCAWSTAQVA